MNKIYFATNVIRYIPNSYRELARAWGIEDIIWGPIIAFGASWALISAIVWLGLMLSFGKLRQGDESIKRAFFVIAVAMGGFATYGAHELIVYALSNIIYFFTVVVSIFVLIAIVRAVWAGVPAAGATVAEAKELEYSAKKELEEARREYEEERHRRMLALKKMINELNSLSDETKIILDEIIEILNKLPEGSFYIQKLEKLKQRIEKSKGKPLAMYDTLNEAIYILEEILGIQELGDKIKNNLKNVINSIRKAIKSEKTGIEYETGKELEKARKELEKFGKELEKVGKDYEAKKELENKKELEEVRKAYEDEEEKIRRKYEEDLKEKLNDLKNYLFYIKIDLGHLTSGFKYFPEVMQIYGQYIKKLEELKEKIENSIEKFDENPSVMYVTAYKAIPILEEFLRIEELKNKLPDRFINDLKKKIDKIKELINDIGKIVKILY